MKRILFTLALLISAPAHATGVIASIKPLHSLVVAVMEGDPVQPELLVDGSASPHGFTLRPSQVRALAKADILFYMGDSYELFIRRVVAGLPGLKGVPMDKTPGIKLYPVRLRRGFDSPMQAHETMRQEYDLHLWMSPENAKRMVGEIVGQLSQVYPLRKERFAANGQKLMARLDALDAELKTQLAPVADKPFIAFHDAFQYFEKAYGLNSQGSISVSPDHLPGAKNIERMREKLRATKVICVFREPQFDTKLVDNLISGTGAKSVTIDPEGALLTPGSELYFELMRNLAKNFSGCLL